MEAILTLKWPKRHNPEVEAFLRRPAFPPEAEVAAAQVLSDIRTRGDAAIVDAVRQFDKAKLTPATFRVPQNELLRAAKQVPPAVQKAIRQAHRNVRTFAKAGLRQSWQIPTAKGGRCGEFFRPIERVGVYIPGGTAPLASSAVMTVTLAKAAGVPEIVACTPCNAEGKVNPALLYALQLAGATEIYRVGGIQAIGMMAFGTKTVNPVRLIAGPGNAYVTAAKRQVYGYVAIDQVAGPSEIAILADDSADAKWIAADMLSQAEHGSGYEKSLLVTTSQELAERVNDEIFWQLQSRSRKVIIERMIANGGMLSAIVPSVDKGLELINAFAPEHFELIVRNAARYLPKVTHAGAVFIGPWTPESAGDFVAGPSHVLPTGGAARMFSGLTAETFRKRTSFVEFTQADLAATRQAIETFGAIEGLDAHGYAATVRFLPSEH